MNTSTYLPLASNPDLCHPHVAVAGDGSPGHGAYGLLTITISDWAPKTPRSTPPSICDGMSAEVSRAFAAAYNGSEHSRLNKRWCVVLHTGTTLILTNVTERPTDPTELPAFVRRFADQKSAETVMQTENAERHRLARVPRQWSVVVCPIADSTNDELAALRECVLNQGRTIQSMQQRLSGSGVHSC